MAVAYAVRWDPAGGGGMLLGSTSAPDTGSPEGTRGKPGQKARPEVVPARLPGQGT